MSQAKVDDADRPTVWVEFGGQLEAMSRAQDAFAPAFLDGPIPLEPYPFGTNPSFGPNKTPMPIVTPNIFEPVSPLAAQKPPANSFGGEAKLSFEPAGSDWVFSASVRYGRSNGSKDLRHQIPMGPYVPNDNYALSAPNPGMFPDKLYKFFDATSNYSKSHAVVDFQAGKDVGLGLFGRNSSSVLNAGIRFAQFTVKSTIGLDADASVHSTAIMPYSEDTSMDSVSYLCCHGP